MSVKEGNTELFIEKLINKEKRGKLSYLEEKYLEAVERKERKN